MNHNPSSGDISFDAAINLLRELFGFSDFLPFQQHVIEGIINGGDLLVVLPTGSGKSLCFQIPALLRDGLTIVISPLIALMKDQVDALCARRLPVACLHSALPHSESKRILDDIRDNRLKMVYISPERLRDGFFLNAVLATGQRPPLWVVDEAHCITEWGHDFRTDYLNIPDAVELISSDSQLVMFTATATPIVREDILRQMRRESARTVCGGFDRPNLYLGCRDTPTKAEKLRTLSELLRRPGPGIIYTATRRQCEDVNRFLQESSGKNSDFYHAGRSAGERTEVHERFLANEIEIVSATNAFGMGVDKPDIRFIIHYAHPASIDAYYQEIGRGGRDCGRCDCILLFSRYDRKVQERFIIDSTPGPDLVEDCFNAIIQTAAGLPSSGSPPGGSPARGLRELILKRSFHEEHHVELFEMEKAGLLSRRTVMCGRASVYLSGDLGRALRLCSTEQMKVLVALEKSLRLSRKGFAQSVDLNAFREEYFPETNLFALEQALLHMSNRDIIVYRPADRSICYEVRADSISSSVMRKMEESVSMRRAFKNRRLEMMIEYGALRSCLREYLLTALADPTPKPTCGFCDNCL
ncbi:MAG: RecQ family ATP-dependent DNA helicase [Candidatus Lindowbacteria bacterium]|nr:RecQ family ATP-dependent DNA helicase [Candidatus Lindowbacteria bacterium]